jgi:penicillin-binding protein 2
MKDSNEMRVLPSTPVERLRLHIVFAVFFAGFLYIVGGLIYRQLVQSGDLKEQSNSQSQRVVLRPPARGRIYDRNGFALVDSRARWSVKADLAALQKEFRAEYLRLVAAEKAREAGKIDRERLMELARLRVLQGWLNKVWFVIDETNRNDKLRRPTAKIVPVTAPGERHVSEDDLRKHLLERRALPFTLISDLAFPGASQAQSPEEGSKSVARFIEQFPVEGPIRLESDNIRTYPFGTLASHVLGYVKDTDQLPENVNDISDVRIETLQKLHYTGKTGAAGVELTYNHVLSGFTGWELWTKTSLGYNQTRLKHSEPAQGSHVFLSLDYRIQAATEAGLAKIKDSQGMLLPAAAVMLDVHTGEILALASQPSFDPNRLADRVSKAYYMEVEKSGAWLNRATQGLYAPGSTFKVVTAIAGMRNKVVDWDDILECGAFYRVGNRDFPEHEPVGYGDVNVDKMLAISCNVWNYQVGLRTGIDALSTEARRFGLDRPLLNTVSDVESGAQPMTELPFAASRGLVVPDRDYKLRIKAGPWTDGDTANLSIGQGYLLTTPLHMASFAASLARGETRTTPSIIHDVRRDGRHQGAEPIGLSKAQLDAIHGGMVRCVEEGTARVARIPGLPYAGKTGTTEYFQKGEKAHLAWMIGFAPADNPVVAFAVLVEGQLDTSTWGGKTAGPVAKEMLEAWAATAGSKYLVPSKPKEEPGR